MILSEPIRCIFVESAETYRVAAVHAEFRLGDGIRGGEKRVAGLMRQAGLVDRSLTPSSPTAG